MKLIFLTTALIVFLVFILPALLSLGLRQIPDAYQPGLEGTQKIYEDISVAQSFISPSNNLNGIGVSLKNPLLENKKDIFFEIYDKDKIMLRRIILNGKNIADGNFIKLIFDPIPGSQNKKFIFILSAPSSSKNEALEIFLTNTKPFFSQDLTVKDEKQDGSISFVTFHKPKSIFLTWIDIYSNWIKRLIMDLNFFIFYTILLTTFLSLYSIYPRRR